MRTHELIQKGSVHTVHDPELLPQMSDWLFEPETLAQRGLIERRTSGRRSAFVFRLGERGFVLRHFWRGGLIGRWLDDSYLWLGLSRSRPLREWRLLDTLHREGLPVPRPAALRVSRQGLLYRADLITLQLPQTQTLADLLQQSPAAAELWQRVGAVIGQLHRRGAFHADLNARNILLDEQNVFLIDWDRGRLLTPAAVWQQRNLERLRRSLEKLSGLLSPFHYRSADFEQLLLGYAQTNPR